MNLHVITGDSSPVSWIGNTSIEAAIPTIPYVEPSCSGTKAHSLVSRMVLSRHSIRTAGADTKTGQGMQTLALGDPMLVNLEYISNGNRGRLESATHGM